MLTNPPPEYNAKHLNSLKVSFPHPASAASLLHWVQPARVSALVRIWAFTLWSHMSERHIAEGYLCLVSPVRDIKIIQRYMQSLWGGSGGESVRWMTGVQSPEHAYKNWVLWHASVTPALLREGRRWGQEELSSWLVSLSSQSVSAQFNELPCLNK